MVRMIHVSLNPWLESLAGNLIAFSRLSPLRLAVETRPNNYVSPAVNDNHRISSWPGGNRKSFGLEF